MSRGKIAYSVLAAVFLIAGCASRLGYPSRTVGIPTAVTLFSKIASSASLNITMPLGARDMWSMLYKKKFEDVLSAISREKLKRQLDIAFSRDAGKAKDLFAASSTEVSDISVDYSKVKADPPAYGGFDFSGEFVGLVVANAGADGGGQAFFKNGGEAAEFLADGFRFAH